MALLQQYVKTGAMPEEEEEPTIEQLSALEKKLTLGKPPYCDFGVFAPFGRNALRASKYRTWIPTAEGQPLHAYKLQALRGETIEALPGRLAFGLLVYAADEMARSQLLSRICIKINMDQKEGRPIPPLFDERKPWETIFKLIPNELKFWQDQIHGPALTWMASGSKGGALTPQEVAAHGLTPTPRWCRGTTIVDGPRGVGHGFPISIIFNQKAGEQGQERSQEEKMAIRTRRTAETSGSPTRRRLRPKTRRQRRREERKERKTKRCHSVGTMGMRLVDHCRRGRNVRIGSGDRIVAHHAIRRVIQLTSARRRSEGLQRERLRR